MPKTRVSIFIDKALWIKFRKRALDEGKSASSLIEELIKEKLKSKS